MALSVVTYKGMQFLSTDGSTPLSNLSGTGGDLVQDNFRYVADSLNTVSGVTTNALIKTANLNDLSSVSGSRYNLGLGDSAVKNVNVASGVAGLDANGDFVGQIVVYTDRSTMASKVLIDGQPGWDGTYFGIGDGSTAWSSLPRFPLWKLGASTTSVSNSTVIPNKAVGILGGHLLIGNGSTVASGLFQEVGTRCSSTTNGFLTIVQHPTSVGLTTDLFDGGITWYNADAAASFIAPFAMRSWGGDVSYQVMRAIDSTNGDVTSIIFNQNYSASVRAINQIEFPIVGGFFREVNTGGSVLSFEIGSTLHQPLALLNGMGYRRISISTATVTPTFGQPIIDLGTLSVNRTIDAPVETYFGFSRAVEGQRLTFLFKTSVAHTETISWDSGANGYSFPTGMSTILTTAMALVSTNVRVNFEWDSGLAKWICVDVLYGHS